MYNLKISIIIPIYNSGKYLDECLRSVVSQNYNNIEIILVNDGSEDNSLEICNNYKNKDKRIKVINNENHGVSYSRNCGIENATGDYIAFVDSDDVIDINFCTILEKMFEKGTDLTCCSFLEGEESFEFIYRDNKELYEKELPKMLLEQFKGFAVNKLYKREIINENNIRFSETISNGEDLLFNIDYLKYVRKVCYNFSKLYGYRINRNSLSRSYSENWFDIVHVYNIILNSNNLPSVSLKQYVNMYLIILFQSKYKLDRMNLTIDYLEKYNIDYHDEVKKYFFDSLTSNDTKIIFKLKLIAWRYFPSIIFFIKNRSLFSK